MPNTMTTKWTPRNQWLTPHGYDLFAPRSKRVPLSGSTTNSAVPTDITEDELTGFRNWEKYIASVLTILEPHPDALHAVRDALRRAREEAKEREQRFPPPRRPSGRG